MKNRFLNIVLLVIALSIVVFKSLEFLHVKNKWSFAVEVMLEYKFHLLESVSNCELIASAKNRSVYYDKLEDYILQNKALSPWDLINEVEELNIKLATLTSHSSMYIDRPKIYRDMITSNNYVGVIDYPIIMCEAEIIRFGNKEYPYKHKYSYIFPIDQPLKLDYLKLGLNYKTGEIDTTLLTREISLAELNRAL